MITAIGLDHFVLRVRDLDATLDFYRDLLGLPIENLEEYRAGTRPFVSVRAGQSLIDFVPDPTYDPQAARYVGGFLHLCIEIEPGLDGIVPWLKARGITVVEDQPVPRLGARGVGLSIYTHDPDGYVLELVSYHK